MIMEAEQLALDFGPPRDVPLRSVEWGMYGTVPSWGPDGTRWGPRTGYVTTPPRQYTGGMGHKNVMRGQPVLSLTLYAPPADGPGGRWTGVRCPMDAVFRELPAPADRPLTRSPVLARRMPAVDLRRGDTVYLWDEPGVPRYHLQADPVPAGDGRVDLLVFVGGQVVVRGFDAYAWIDVCDPVCEPWVAAPSGLRQTAC